MNSCLYEGVVNHRRSEPVEHTFRYRVVQLFLDLDELDTVFAGRWFWSTRRPAIGWFKRSDYFGDPKTKLSDCVRDFVEEKTGERPVGAIRVLTHPRYFGFVMNPVSFYYCYDAANESVVSIVAEITNTPWGERHAYVLSAPGVEESSGDFRFQFEKVFHVSPFMPMDHKYDWQFTSPDEQLCVRMENHADGNKVFEAHLMLKRRAMSGTALVRALVCYPLMTVKIAIGIYWQALRLYLKRVPFHTHPNHVKTQEAS
ncbi:MAG: DUF1365 family protein [Planctomycetota bacterium]|jgi:DUF1365 family protein